MAFQVLENGRLKALLLAPASDTHCATMSGYALTKFPQFRHAQVLDNNYLKWIPTILSHVLREEHTFTYNAQKVNLE